jgi:hypothetical protein
MTVCDPRAEALGGRHARVLRCSAEERTFVGSLTALTFDLYNVHVKRVTASDARKNWFRLLDEAVKGEVIAIERNGSRLILKLDKRKKSIPDYKKWIRGNWDNADKWGWKMTKAGRMIPIVKK